jgi:hypothetical protein
LVVADLAELVCRGGWPAQLERPLAAACRAARDYLEQVRQVDVQRVDGRRRDPQRLGALLRSLGRFAPLVRALRDRFTALSQEPPSNPR